MLTLLLVRDSHYLLNSGGFNSLDIISCFRSQLFFVDVIVFVKMFRPVAFTRASIVSISCNRWCNSAQQWIRPEGYDTGVSVYNCVARDKVPLIVRNRNLATFYTCGPTVYDDTHLGHASCYVKLDIVQRILRDYLKVSLLTAMNITDIDDKIIRRGQETRRDWQEIARENEEKFWTSLRDLNVQQPDYKVRVTEHLPEIKNFIQRLLDKEQAYLAKDDSIYFDCASLPVHGKLSRVSAPSSAEEPETKSFIKKSSSDFALWKAVNSGPAFDTEFGAGRPGWHIECSAMASKLFGDCIDFHGGGWDLKFPHHENEESQSCAFHGTNQWVNYWMHTGQLRLKGDTEKMSKSLKNTVSVTEFLGKYSANDFRMFCLLSNYQSNTEYSDEGIQTAQRVLAKFRTFLDDVQMHLTGQRKLRVKDNTEFREKIETTMNSFDLAIRDDFDTSRALKSLLDLMGYINKSQHEDNGVEIDSGLLNFSDRFYRRQLGIFGLTIVGDEIKPGSPVPEVDINPVIEAILEVRNELRRRAKSSNDKSLYSFGDYIRKQLDGAGIEIKDRDKQTTTWTRK